MSTDTAIQSLKQKIDDLNQQAWEARVNDSPKSFELSQESVKLARSINYSKGLAEGLRSLGLGYVRFFKDDEAAPLLRESLSLFQSLNDLRGQGIIYEYLGIIERNLGNLGASLGLLLKGNDLVRQTGPLEIEITSCYQVGVTYKHLGNHENALDYLYRSISLSKKINFTLMEAYATNIIGSIYFDNGDYNHALDCYQQGLITRQQSHDKWGEAGSLDNIGFTYLKLNDLDKAIDYCKQSLQITQGTDDKKGEANTLLHLAEIYQQAGDIGQASKFSNESLEIRKARGDKRGEAEALLFLANLHKHENDVKDRQVFGWLSDAWKIAGEIKAQDLLSKACYNLHEYHTQKGNYKESLAQLEAHLQIEKELHKNAINQKISNLEISHKAETISQRNKELTELNEQIEKANEDLKIERSLERVRTAAMAMKEPADMLEVCKIISDQLEILDVKKIRNVQTAIFYEEKSSYTNYEYYAKHDKLLVTEVDYNNHPVAEKFANQMLKGPNQVWTHGFKGDEVKDWLNYQRSTNVFIDTYLETADSLNYYWYSLGPVALGMSTYAPLNENEIDLFKRFRNVFELAYRRYLDIEKAQAQAREAQIETGMERVRSKTMAMHKSEEVTGVAVSLNEELLKLGFEGGSTIIIMNKETGDMEQWTGFSEDKSLKSCIVPYFKHPCHDAQLNAWKKGEKFLVYTVTGEEKKTLDDHYFETGYKDFPESDKTWMRDMESVTFSHAFMKYGAIHWGPNNLTEEQLGILQRFSKVFEQSYTRFLDLQKAEAQARESQIQLALERVRARAMAMQRSNELADAAQLLFHQVKELGVQLWGASFQLWDEDKKEVTVWSCIKDFMLPPFKIPATEDPLMINIFEAERKGEILYVEELSGAALESNKKYMMSIHKFKEDIVGVADQGYVSIELMIFHAAFFSDGYILFITLEPRPESHDIFIRFAKVFEQTYTRFLDLQKAEAQTREAKIEAALERARTQSMIMQHSKELDDTLRVFHEQVLLLGINSAFSFLWLPDEDKNRHIFWAAWAESVSFDPLEKKDPTVFDSKAINYPLDRNEPATAQCLIDWKGKEPVVSYHVPPAGVESYFAAWHELIAGVDQLKPEYFSNGLYYVEAFMKYGCFGVMVESGLSEDEKKILLRFSIEFERTYTRFLDLQKSEAQARESQIQLALERVRARTMAMQHSNELQETAVLLFQQVKSLDILTGSCSFNIWDTDEPVATVWSSSVEGNLQAPFKLSHTESPIYRDVYASMKRGDEILVKEVGGEELKKHFVYLTTIPVIGDVINKLRKSGYLFPENIIYHFAFFKQGYLSFHLHELQPETNEVFVRFAKVFDQTYTRFLDLQKAEAQARDAQIEVALERVRSKVMAMSSSKDLNETSLVFGEQLRKLGIDWQFSYFWLIDETKNENTFWITWPDYKTSITAYTIAEAEQYFNDCLVSWRAGVKIHDNYVPPEGVQDWLDTFQRITDDAGGEAKRVMVFDTFSSGVYYYDAMMKYGSFGICISKPATDEEKNIQSRFAIEFERAYTRFLDLKHAEAQSREAQIELGLERVRARAMAMQNSDELKELIGTVYTELTKLDLILDRCFIMIYDNKAMGVTWWMSNPEAPLQPTGLFVKYHEQPPYLAFIKGWKERNLKWQYILEGEVKKTWDKFLFVETELSRLPDFVIANMKANEKVYLSASFNNFGCLTLATLESLSDEHFDILLRFAKVFDLTYTRFNDLKQAEAQAREAQIELGLEKVRAKAMAMHKTDDLRSAVATVFEELDKLDLGLIRCGIAILDKEKPRGDIWITIKSEKDSIIEVSGDEPLDIHPLLKGAYDAWLKQQDFLYVLQNDELLNYYRAIKKTNFQGPVSASFDTEKDQRQHYFNAVFQDGSLFAFLHEAFTDEAKMVMKRFANVFNLTYKRFLDLQKAEAQAREARIETALEKVRASTMAMQRSEDLSQTAFVLFNQFKELGEAPERIFIATFDDHDKGIVDIWGTDQGGKQLNKLFKVPVNEPTMVSKIVAAWKDKKRSVVIDLKGEELKTYLGFLKQAGIPVTEGIMTDRRVQTAACFSNGVIGVTTSEPQSAEAVQLQERFAGVFDLTYTRFLDLQKAEAQTREALIEGALERVRARALAMQQPEELKDVAQVLRNEMGALGVEELETCSIYIHGDSSDNVECWYALQDPKHAEKKMVSDHFVLNLDDTWVGREMKKFYSSGEKQTSIVMQGMNRKEWIKYCYEHSPVFSGFYGESIPDRTYHLYKFSHGYIGAAAPGDISDESWKLLGRAASVFSLAYSRFKDLTQARNDLIRLKEEKKRAEEALTELQATQKQLIQSEKMASLGELTAGIAHEIQNPLNFVNNFSDVSNELLEEMKAELEKGNTEGAKEIAIDVKENLEKILHHGKRADAIVKGMLQHSRSSSGQKELTDINVLAEEYLRLAYHGLRAKDKFFNAKFETDLDRSINKINVVPQEIGRVILNLINNSFYAVSEKKKNSDNGYEPIVIVSTKAVKPPLGGLEFVEIRVTDNGNGIPKKVLDKIFQPFFTTKPTGVGTGLGLSLSYDIITKGHDGEIKVETKEGEGSAFIISLPMK